MLSLFDQSTFACSQVITEMYSTSFSSAIKMLAPRLRPPIHAIYGFVRYADEIVDTLHAHNKAELIAEFEADYHKALSRKISLNPILHAFQSVVNQYNLSELVAHFLKSMKMDLDKKEYLSQTEYEEYIYGSAVVVGLMCLKIFVDGNEAQYEALKNSAMRLGSAFQKVNFLRDLKDDLEQLDRSYFPNVDLRTITTENKAVIIQDIEADFAEAYKGVVKLPDDAKFGVYTAYQYYQSLLEKLKRTKPEEIMTRRIRVSDPAKAFILANSYLKYKLHWI